VPHESNFMVIQATRDGRPAFILIDAGLDWRKDRARFPWLLRIELPIREPDAQGLCSREEADHLNEVEDRLLARLGSSDSRYVGHITWNAVREVLVYVRDHEEALRLIEHEAGVENIELGAEPDPEWEEYRQFPV